MKFDDVIRWAREAGMEQDGDNFFSPSHEEIDVHITDLERFAALVAAAERERFADECIDLVASYGGPVDLEADIRARGQA